MFAIFRNNKRYGTKSFNTYEQARSAARKLIRGGKFTLLSNVAYDWNMVDYRNPTISQYGLSIKAI